jgi:hypothetical protein
VTTLLATRVCLLVVQVLLPRPTEPSQPTSKPQEKGEADDAAPMSDGELSALSVSLDDAIPVEAIPDATTKSVAQAPQASDSVPPQAPAPPGRASDRSVRDTFPPSRTKQDVECVAPGLPSDSALAPRLLAPRWEPGAALLGGLVGFGTGHFYAGAPRRGVVLSITDTLLLGGLASSIWALNEHVVREDRRTGLSLARDERSRDGTESTLYAVSWGLGIAAGVSRVFQAIDGYRAAAHTNAELRNVSIVPLASVTRGGAQVALAWSW